MTENDGGYSRKRALDDFWNIDMIAPKKKATASPAKHSTDTVEIKLGSALGSISEGRVYGSETLSGTAVTRSLLSEVKQSEPEISYSPENSLIHKVRIYKWSSPYSYYEDFYREALRLCEVHGEEAPRVGFFSYVPQYDQLNSAQLAYYLYFREQARAENFIDADYSYILLYAYELLNLGDRLDTAYARSQLVALWRAYRVKYPKLNKLLIEWICDYSLIHQLPPPRDIELASIADICTLKEFFVETGGRDYLAYAPILLSFCNSYDFHTSKFAQGEALPIYEKYIPLALAECIKALSGNGVLSNVGFNDSLLPRDAYSGALCSHRIKRKIEVEYCSFSRTNELRYLVGDIVKYCENKIRAYLGIKPRLSCYSLDVELRKLLDSFFDTALPRQRRPRNKEKRQEYDVFYDLPAKPLSLSDASAIEEQSWETTRELIEAFDGEDIDAEIQNETQTDVGVFSLDSVVQNISENTENCAGNELLSALGEYLAFAEAVWHKDTVAQRNIATVFGSMPDSIVDAINEISVDIIGDILIEDDGEYRIIEDYEIYFTGDET